MNIALKEWASIVEALATGRQIAMLRKGGIVEAARNGFELRHREFLLFPTHEHQQVAMLQPQWQGLLQRPEDDTIPIHVLARAEEARPAPANRDWFLERSEEFVWNEAFVNLRYDYRPDLPLWLILLRILRIPPVRIPNRGAYAGCKSWVNLTEEIDTRDAALVVSDQEFQRRRLAL